MVLRFNIFVFSGLLLASVMASAIKPRDQPNPTLPTSLPFQNKEFTSGDLSEYAGLFTSSGALSSYQASVFSKLDSIASAEPTAASSIKSVESAFQSQLSALSFQDQTSRNPEIFSSGLSRLSSSIANAGKTGAPSETGDGNGGSSLEMGRNLGAGIALVTLASLVFSVFALV